MTSGTAISGQGLTNRSTLNGKSGHGFLDPSHLQIEVPGDNLWKFHLAQKRIYLGLHSRAHLSTGYYEAWVCPTSSICINMSGSCTYQLWLRPKIIYIETAPHPKGREAKSVRGEWIHKDTAPKALGPSRRSLLCSLLISCLTLGRLLNHLVFPPITWGRQQTCFCELSWGLR